MHGEKPLQFEADQQCGDRDPYRENRGAGPAEENHRQTSYSGNSNIPTDMRESVWHLRSSLAMQRRTGIQLLFGRRTRGQPQQPE